MIKTKPFAVCIENTDFLVSLIPGKVYGNWPDPTAVKDDLARIIDERGEEYLYHKGYFVFVDFPPSEKKRILPCKASPNQPHYMTPSDRILSMGQAYGQSEED